MFSHSPALVSASTKKWERPLTNGLVIPGDRLDQRLRNDVKMLGGILGDTIKKHSGEWVGGVCVASGAKGPGGVVCGIIVGALDGHEPTQGRKLSGDTNCLKLNSLCIC